MQYVLARTPSKRPTLMHALADPAHTACGLDITAWSRAYLERPLTQIMCIKCKAKALL